VCVVPLVIAAKVCLNRPVFADASISVPLELLDGDVKPDVMTKLVFDQVVPKFSLCKAKFCALGSTKSAGHPTVPSLAK
jgi:hypothetical protein